MLLFTYLLTYLKFCCDVASIYTGFETFFFIQPYSVDIFHYLTHLSTFPLDLHVTCFSIAHFHRLPRKMCPLSVLQWIEQRRRGDEEALSTDDVQRSVENRLFRVSGERLSYTLTHSHAYFNHRQQSFSGCCLTTVKDCRRTSRQCRHWQFLENVWRHL